MKLLQNLSALNLKLAAQQVLGVIDRFAQHVTYRQEVGFVLIDNAAVGRYAHLTVGECIQGVNGLVR